MASSFAMVLQHGILEYVNADIFSYNTATGFIMFAGSQFHATVFE